MRIIDLALKDLSQMLRDKRSLLFIVAMPIVFTLFMGFAYRGDSSSDENVDTRIPLALVDPQPDSVLNKMFLTRLESSDAIRIVSMSESEAMDSFRKGEVAGVLVIEKHDGDVHALAVAVRAAHSPGELIAVAPAWLSPLVQRELGDLMPVEHLSRPDAKRFARCRSRVLRSTCRRSFRRPRSTDRWLRRHQDARYRGLLL